MEEIVYKYYEIKTKNVKEIKDFVTNNDDKVIKIQIWIMKCEALYQAFLIKSINQLTVMYIFSYNKYCSFYITITMEKPAITPNNYIYII